MKCDFTRTELETLADSVLLAGADEEVYHKIIGILCEPEEQEKLQLPWKIEPSPYTIGTASPWVGTVPVMPLPGQYPGIIPLPAVQAPATRGIVRLDLLSATGARRSSAQISLEQGQYYEEMFAPGCSVLIDGYRVLVT